MRCLGLVSLIALAAAFPTTARASPGDIAATRSAIRATMTADRELHAAAPRAGGAAQAIRLAARRCLPDFERVPVVEQETVYGFYFVSLSSGLWFVDKPMLRRWIVDGLAPAARRSAAWRDERRRLLRNLALVDRIYSLGRPDVCPAITAWRGRDFAADQRPAAIEAIRRAVEDPALSVGTSPAAAIERLLLHSGDPRADRVMFLLNRGADEPDDRVERLDDPIVDLFRI